MSAPTIDTTREALVRAREHAGATLHSLGEAVEEFAHEAVEKLEEALPVLAEKAGEKAAELGEKAGELAGTARELLEESGGKLDEGVLAARRELAQRIDPGPPQRRWLWIVAVVVLTAGSAAVWYLLSRRPQAVEGTEPPPRTPPGDLDLKAETPAHATRNGKS
ncbi:hypothetical protein GCM10009836_62760 [Pseudonocardia ailaonensis]|uniref:DUF3618 domain-containing protein n=1 Tax=Pseudonocardia ailaonensis TaxID=367279 RepID=A0ABN2NKH0_9PSEU